nr:DNA helicase Pif1-like protein [Tanacetum cinerariifolium]
MFIEFVIQNQFFSYSLEEFAQTLDIACEGACVFTDKWSLIDELAYGVPTDGPYQTNPPSPHDIISSIRIDQTGQVRCIRHEEEIDVLEFQILTRKIVPTLKPLEEIIRENVFYLGRKTRRDHGTRRGRHSTSSFLAFDQPSSSHLNDDDRNGQGTSCANTLSPIHYVSSLTKEVPQVFQNPPNINPHLEPFNTRQTKIINRQVQIRDEHRGGLRSIEKDLKNLWRNIKKPSNPQPLQSHPSLDITLSLSPITLLDHIRDTLSPPSPPQPQPPIMGHSLYYNYHDYHGSTCICNSHNQTLFLILRDEMNIMFAHLQYLLTTVITSHFLPLP